MERACPPGPRGLLRHPGPAVASGSAAAHCQSGELDCDRTACRTGPVQEHWMPGLLVIMGSGETAPTMVKAHRSIFERVGDRPAVLLDTPYGFQSNADDITARAVSYFQASVGRTVTPVSWRTAPPPGLTRERALAAINGAGWVFAGPGSPTYALRHWRGTPLEEAFVEVL